MKLRIYVPCLAKSPGLVTSDYGVQEVGVTLTGVHHVLGVRVRPRTRCFPYNENLTRALPHSNAACNQLTLLISGKNSRMRIKVQGRLMQARFFELHQVFANKKRSNSFLTE